MNTLLPHDIRVLAVREVPGSFSVRFDALSREYHYWLQYGSVHDPLRRRQVGFVKGDLDVSAMEDVAACMVGTHDFAAFANLSYDRSSTTRTLYSLKVIRLEDGCIKFEVCGFRLMHKIFPCPLMLIQSHPEVRHHHRAQPISAVRGY